MRAMLRSVTLALSVPLTAMSVALAGVEQAKLLPSDGEQLAHFGFSVALDGDTAAIGAPADFNENGKAGAVYIFNRTGDTWFEQDKLIADDGVPLDRFGEAMALDGDTLVVGAPDDDDNGVESGSAYVFTRVGGVWTQQAKFLPLDGAAGEQFGLSVAIDEDTVVVGTTDVASDDVGQAYIFERFGSSWIQLAKLVQPDFGSFNGFGRSVAIEDDWVAIGASGDNVNDFQSGSVYIYRRTANWNFQTKLQPSDGGIAKRFGSALDMDGDLLLIGSISDYENGNSSGSAYVFRRVLLAWNEEAKLLPSDGVEDANFSTSLAVHGDSIVVGAPGKLSGTPEGSAYIFGPVRGAWTQRFKLLPADSLGGARFGAGVAVFGESAIVGAWADDDNGPQSGSAYAFDFPPLPPDDVPAVGRVGVIVLLLTTLGGGAWIIRRR